MSYHWGSQFIRHLFLILEAYRSHLSPQLQSNLWSVVTFLTIVWGIVGRISVIIFPLQSFHSPNQIPTFYLLFPQEIRNYSVNWSVKMTEHCTSRPSLVRCSLVNPKLGEEMQRMILLQKNDLFLGKNQTVKKLDMPGSGKHSWVQILESRIKWFTLIWAWRFRKKLNVFGDFMREIWWPEKLSILYYCGSRILLSALNVLRGLISKLAEFFFVKFFSLISTVFLV